MVLKESKSVFFSSMMLPWSHSRAGLNPKSSWAPYIGFKDIYKKNFQKLKLGGEVEKYDQNTLHKILKELLNVLFENSLDRVASKPDLFYIY